MRPAYDRPYAYARICGAVAKAFLGKKALGLARAARVGEAWRAFFGETPPALPEEVLLAAAQAETQRRALRDFRRLAAGLEVAEPFFAALLRKPDFAYAKRVAVAAAEKRPAPPERPDPEGSTDILIERYPDTGRMFGGTRFDWIAKEGVGDLTALKNRVDRQYFEELWLALDSAPSGAAARLRGLIALETELQNVVWALRLRRYYALGRDEIERLLVRLAGRDVERPALQALALKPDRRQDWAGWKWERFIGDRGPGGGEWSLDVRGIESAARRFAFRAIRRALHLDPFGYAPLYAFFRIKEIESAAVNGIFEGIRLESPSEEIAAFALDATGGAA